MRCVTLDLENRGGGFSSRRRAEAVDSAFRNRDATGPPAGMRARKGVFWKQPQAAMLGVAIGQAELQGQGRAIEEAEPSIHSSHKSQTTRPRSARGWKQERRPVPVQLCSCSSNAFFRVTLWWCMNSCRCPENTDVQPLTGHCCGGVILLT